MDSSSSVPNDPSKNSKKRVFSEDCPDPDIVKISSPVNLSFKSKALKMKEVANQEIINIDSDDEFDKFDIPTGVETHVPWFSGPVQNKSTLAITDVSHSLWSVDPQRMKSTTGSIMESPIYAVSHPTEEDPYSFWSTTKVEHAQTMSRVFYNGSASSDGASQTSHIPSDSFLLGSHVQNASEAFSIYGYKFNDDSSEILKKFEDFKKFDIVEDTSDHHYVNDGTSARKPSKSWSKRIQEEWKILEKDLPDTILVRAYESRMDLLRAVIVGAEGTPYHDGLFFFDVFFPNHYPYGPPHVYYHSGGLKVNPNLSTDGRLCLSLLNTWHGSPEERWIPNISTVLQVLISIQGLILNANPYFNEAGFSNFSGTPHGEAFSQNYNEETFIKSVQTMVFTLRKQPLYFEDFLMGHFFKRAGDILVACKAYMEGAQVGCLVQGGIQDVDEGDKTCSLLFRAKLPPYIKLLVDTFTEIGVKGCDQFVPPAKTGTMTVNSFP